MSTVGYAGKTLDMAPVNVEPPPDLVPKSSAHSVSDRLMLNLIASGADLTTIIMARNILDTSKQSQGVMKKFDQIRASRELLSGDLKFYRRLQEWVHSIGDKDNNGRVGLGLDEDFFKDFHKFYNENKEEIFERFPMLQKYDWALSSDKGIGSIHGGDVDAIKKEIQDAVLDNLFADMSYQIDEDYKVTRLAGGRYAATGAALNYEEIKEYADGINSKVSDLDTAKEIEQMRLQELVQLKQRQMTLASNIADSAHKARKSVIDNTRT